MRKIILGVAVSLDGFVEGPNGEYDWCFMDQDYGMKNFLKGIDAIFFGRKSYEVMLAEIRKTGTHPFAGKKNYVFSNTRREMAGATLISGDVGKKVKEMKSEPGKDIWLFGGPSLTSSLMRDCLVDELWLAVHPILLGSGKPLFSGIKERITTQLLDTKSYDTGLLSLNYKVNYKSP